MSDAALAAALRSDENLLTWLAGDTERAHKEAGQVPGSPRDTLLGIWNDHRKRHAAIPETDGVPWSVADRAHRVAMARHHLSEAGAYRAVAAPAPPIKDVRGLSDDEYARAVDGHIRDGIRARYAADDARDLADYESGKSRPARRGLTEEEYAARDNLRAPR